MKNVKEKIVKLKNRYSGDIVYTRNIKETVSSENIIFVKVFKEENPQREFLVNLNAFEVQDK
jgi:hypothetical protein